MHDGLSRFLHVVDVYRTDSAVRGGRPGCWKVLWSGLTTGFDRIWFLLLPSSSVTPLTPDGSGFSGRHCA